MQGRFYVTVQGPSVRLSYSPAAVRAACLLLWARRVEDIDQLLTAGAASARGRSNKCGLRVD